MTNLQMLRDKYHNNMIRVTEETWFKLKNQVSKHNGTDRIEHDFIKVNIPDDETNRLKTIFLVFAHTFYIYVGMTQESGFNEMISVITDPVDKESK